MKKGRMKTGINFKGVLAAAVTGGALQFAQRQIPSLNEKFQAHQTEITALGSAAIGLGILHFGKSEMTKAAGYAAVGVGGAYGAEYFIAKSEPLQGLFRRKKRIVSKAPEQMVHEIAAAHKMGDRADFLQNYMHADLLGLV